MESNYIIHNGGFLSMPLVICQYSFPSIGEVASYQLNQIIVNEQLTAIFKIRYHA